LSPGQVRVDVQDKLGRTPLYAAQQQVLNDVKANRAQVQGIPDHAMKVIEFKGLKKP